MDLLEMPLEALALRFYSLPAAAAGSVWAWVAVLATALGVWSIRAVGSRSDGSSPPPPAPSPPPPPPKIADASRAVREAPAAAAAVGSPAACPVEGSCGSPKARFTTYYYSCESSSDVGEDDDGELDGGADGAVDEQAAAAAPWMEARWRGDLGWYRYQDRSAINGSVVRLWNEDGGFTATATARRKRLSTGW